MSGSADIDVISLAAAALRKGYDSPERIVKRMERVIARCKAYTARRRAQGYAGDIDDKIDEDAEIVAAAIVLIESMAFNKKDGGQEQL